VRFAALALAGGPVLDVVLAAAGTLACVPLALGWRDRLVAPAAAVGLAALVARGAVPPAPSAALALWLLAAHAFAPRAPYGSWEGRGRPDPGGGWTLPPWIFLAHWIVLAGGYAFAGVATLAQGGAGSAPEAVFAALALVFGPLALAAPARPWIWTALVVAHPLLLLLGSGHGALGFLLLHAFAFDPAWLPPRAAGRVALFYDGECGLCHRTVRFLLAEDRTGIRFAPLQGETFAALEARDPLPDSVVVQAPDGSLLVRARAVLFLGDRIGGAWRALAKGIAVVPLTLLDRLYDFVARVRHKLFARPEELCPIRPPHLGERFLD